MDFDLFSCTFENLNNLKFNELQKLSSRFRVNKRWAKKREIIEKLLLLRDQEIVKMQLPADSDKTNKLQEDIEWVDANKVFATKDVDQGSESEENCRRLTYNISNSDIKTTERRLTYKVEKAENLLADHLTHSNFDRRLTYNADEIKSGNKDLDNVSQAPNAGKGLEILEELGVSKENTQFTDQKNTNNSGICEDTRNKINVGKYQHQSNPLTESATSKIKMLTVPYTRIVGHNNSRSKAKNLKSNVSEILEKTSKIQISNNKLLQNIKATLTVPQDSNVSKDTGHLKYSIEKNVSKMPVRKLPENFSVDIKNELLRQNTGRNISSRQKSKTEDNVLVKSFKHSENLKFYSPKESDVKNSSTLLKPDALELDLNCRSRIPKAKPAVSIQKPIAATKMPNFSKIHQRRFEQMDSLIDYKRKKEERAKKLFGAPQPGIPIKANKVDVTKVFQFISSNNEKENFNKSTNILKKDNIDSVKGIKEKSSRKDVLNRSGSKSNIVMNLKEQNRKHLHGVRTNKRFELQMKSRKL